jgi:hypothetical protein
LRFNHAKRTTKTATTGRRERRRDKSRKKKANAATWRKDKVQERISKIVFFGDYAPGKPAASVELFNAVNMGHRQQPRSERY